jgi:hypothetical protein
MATPRHTVLLSSLTFIAAALASSAAHAAHISVDFGGGLGTFLRGGAGVEYPNAHRTVLIGFTLPGDRVELRVLHGTLERPRGIPKDVGDDDFDYRGVDVVLTRNVTHLPFAVTIGVNRYEELYHIGYPHEDLGGSQFVHRWGPKVGAWRSWPFLRYFEGWAGADVNFAPYQPRQVVLMFDLGIGARF